MRADEGQVEELVDRCLEDSADRLLGERALGDDCLSVAAALEVAVRDLLVPAHVSLEVGPPRLDR